MVKGVCRKKNGWGLEDSVCVLYPTGDKLEIPVSQYEGLGYLPSYADLDWCEGDRLDPEVSG